ncbi:DUF3467 domain-containing protein [uncultured Methanospirillum sp.]|uniref:DUF3467 domain-containing protein n=1 Tax=uncultured Methanospirillum sp. TaxID=262503 RepID=UPI0029C636EE|nr:DUF3467 domain-containing protein [uncultured Methanospirillum sp.]
MTSNEIQVTIPPNLEPVYSNMIQIAYKEDEFTFMFLHQIPGINQARGKAVVSISPTHAKNLLQVLQRTVGEYEQKFRPLEASQEKAQNVTSMTGYS